MADTLEFVRAHALMLPPLAKFGPGNVRSTLSSASFTDAFAPAMRWFGESAETE